MPDQLVTMLTEIGKAAEQAGPMRASSVIRRRGAQRRTRQRVAAGVLSAVAVGAIVATSSILGMHRTAINLPVAPPSATADAAASPTTAPSPSSTPLSTASPTQSSAPSTSPPLTLYGPDGCPVNSSTLVAALKSSSSDIYTRSGKPSTLVRVTCYQGYALGQTPNDGVSQQSWILFGYKANGGWQPLNLGSADYCVGIVPNDIAQHLPGCSFTP